MTFCRGIIVSSGNDDAHSNKSSSRDCITCRPKAVPYRSPATMAHFRPYRRVQRILGNDGRRKTAKQQLSKFYREIRLVVRLARPYDLLTSLGSSQKTICSQPLCCCLQLLCRTSSSVAYRAEEANRQFHYRNSDTYGLEGELFHLRWRLSKEKLQTGSVLVDKVHRAGSDRKLKSKFSN